MSSAILAGKLVVFTVILCFVAVKLPFRTSIQVITDRSKSSLGLFSDSKLSDEESAELMRKHSMAILLETLKIALFITLLVITAVVVWFALNFNHPFSAASFEVFYSIEGIVFSLVGIGVFVGLQKVLRRA